MSKIHIFFKALHLFPLCTLSVLVFFFLQCPALILRLSLHKTQYIHVPGRIRTYNFTKRSAANFG
jgi:hypothetical protein